MKSVLLLILFAFASAVSVTAQPTLPGQVIEVIDGRTVVIAASHNAKFRVQLRSIEIPDENQELHDIVKTHTSQMLLGKSVTFLGTTAPVSAVYLNGIDASAQLLRDGAAWLLLNESSSLSAPTAENYRQMESLAKAEKRGIWADPNLVPPSRIRKLAITADNPFSDADVAQVAWQSLGPAVEGVFGDEIYSVETGSCSGQVVRVVDGDTVKIRTDSNQEITVRLAGIDAPEMSQSGGIEAKQALSNMVLGRTVGCDSAKKDRYGRTVGKLTLNGSDIGLEMIRSGNAWHYKKYSSEQNAADRVSYGNADSSAKSARRGIFADHLAMAPWDYRAERFLSYYVRPIIQRGSPQIFGSGYSGSGGSSSGAGPVHVRSYTRQDGTFVQSHTRSRPN